MKNWSWLLPCWVWKYFFEQLPRESVLLDGRMRFLIRLDEDFALIYDPHKQEPEAHYVHRNIAGASAPARVFVPSKSRTLLRARASAGKFLRTREFGIGPLLAHKVIERWHGLFHQSSAYTNR